MASKKFNNVYIKDNFSIVGPLESEGLLKNFNLVMDNYYYGEKTFEQAEIKMQKMVMDNLLSRNKLTDSKIDLLVGGDLLNQISVSSYNAAKYRIPYLGVYSACASYIEELIVAASFISGKLAKNVVAITSSHNLNAERQFRYPVEYGAVKKHTTTFTTTAAVATLLTSEISNIKIKVKSPIAIKDLRIYHSTVETSTIIIENIMLDVECDSTSATAFILSSGSKKGIDLKSYVINIKTSSVTKRFYYGSDFSDYFVNFKTGNIGLKAIDGKGLFYGKIDENWLQNKGYTKKTV